MKSLNEVIKITNKETDYIVANKSSKKVSYYGSNRKKAFETYNSLRASGKRVYLSEPLTKHVATKEELERWDSAPTMYSGI